LSTVRVCNKTSRVPASTRRSPARHLTLAACDSQPSRRKHGGPTTGAVIWARISTTTGYDILCSLNTWGPRRSVLQVRGGGMGSGRSARVVEERVRVGVSIMNWGRVLIPKNTCSSSGTTRKPHDQRCRQQRSPQSSHDARSERRCGSCFGISVKKRFLADAIETKYLRSGQAFMTGFGEWERGAGSTLNASFLHTNCIVKLCLLFF
jgi:hypothetical protein